MAEVELTKEDREEGGKRVKMSRVYKERKNMAFLQKKKDKGEKIVQCCPVMFGPMFAIAAEMADVDIARIAASHMATMPDQMISAPLTIDDYRRMTNIIHLNLLLPTGAYADKATAFAYCSDLVHRGCDSVLPMGVTNDMLKHLTDNYVPVYGHIGAISGWQTAPTGYKRIGKTAEDAMRVFKMGYEYQENGMGGMTIELTPIEVSAAVAKKLRVPVIGIAGGAACDGSEMVDMDLFGVNPNLASHAVQTADFLQFAIDGYIEWWDMVTEGKYPEDKHGWHMDPVELEKFNEMVEKF